MRHISFRTLAWTFVLAAFVVGCDTDATNSSTLPPTADPGASAPLDDGDPVSPAVHDAGDTACQSAEGEGPWHHSLEEWSSPDGITFTHVRTFQVCADVPSVAQGPDGLWVAVYQAWETRSDKTRWDKIAVRFSDNDAETWSSQTFITVEGLPDGTGRPFDPAIAYDPASELWRLYFSLTTNTQNQLDGDVCTHSATSDDGVNYVYEAETRFCADNKPVIDPTVALWDGTWFYIAPSGAPQDGAYFATSEDGIAFTEQLSIPSDMNHNWTGNLVVSGDGLRFYGGEVNRPHGNYLWFAELKAEGASWSDYVQTNIPAGKDPAVIRRADGTYRVYVPTRTD